MRYSVSNNYCSSVNNAYFERSILIALLLPCLLVTAPQVVNAQIEISEFMASNDETLFDEDGDASDWIELRNTSAAEIDLAGWYLTDDEDELTQWQFPSTMLAANDFIVVFASDKERAISGSELHTNFRLSRGGEYLALVAPDGTTVVSGYAPEYPQQFNDVSFGGGNYFLQATPGAVNGAGVLGFASPIESDLAHGIYSAPQTLNLSTDLPAGEIRYTLDGREPSTEFGCVPPADGKPWSYDYYQGVWQALPDFDALTAIASGTTDNISIEPAQRANNFGLRFKGCLEASIDGYYTLSTSSDDGSRLYLNDELVIDNDGLHGNQTVSNQVFLSKGLYPLTLEYFQDTGDSNLSLDWIAPLRGQSYLTTANDGQFYNPPALANNIVSFEFDVPADGDFRFSVNARGVDSDSDSFWVQLDGQEFWQFEIGQSSNFQDVLLNDNGTIITATLSAGEHHLKFYPREDGAQINSLNIQAVSCDGPCANQQLEAEIQEISGIFVLAGLDQETLPGEAWHSYSSALNIDKTTILRSVAVQENYIASEISTSSYLFFDDIVDQSPNEEPPIGWPSVVATQQDMDYGMDPNIVGPDRAAVIDSLASLPSISIVTDIDNLLHRDFGIYVNAQELGRYWERPAHVELIDGSGAEPGFSIDAGIRIRGGFSRRSSNPKHPFRLYFRGSYDGDLDYPLFGDEGTDSFNRIDLRSPNNYNWASTGDARNTFLREVWSRDTQNALGNPYTRSRYYHMYLNGQYWGITMTQERVTDKYAEDYFGGDENDYDVVKHDRANNFRFESSDGFNQSWNQIADIVFSSGPLVDISDSQYSLLEQQVDLDNLIDYILSNGFEGDLDGAVSWFLQSGATRWSRANNWYAVRNRSEGGLKWAFFQHDGEHTLGVRRNQQIEGNVLGPFAPFDGTTNQFYQREYMNPYWLHQKLTSHLDYRQRVIDRAAQLFSPAGALSNEQGLARWNSRKQQVSAAVLAHSARWGDSKRSTPLTVVDWQNEVDFVENTFFLDRAETVVAQLIELGLANDLPTPEVSIDSGSSVNAGTSISIVNASTGSVYYTIDGSDPRAQGGGISANAILLLPGESIVITDNTQLTIRILEDDNWSAPTEATYTVINEEPSEEPESQYYVIPLKNGKSVIIHL